MTVTLPRIDRASGLRILEVALEAGDPASLMPVADVTFTFAPLGMPVGPSDGLFSDLRRRTLALAVEHGMPGPILRRAEFEGRCARLVRELLPITPHEASSEDVWTYVTCCHLLDVAAWRWGGMDAQERFYGHVNRNTFRRMWWRAEILGAAVDLSLLGEDEYSAIMERPTIASNRPLARAIAREIVQRAEAGVLPNRMVTVRDALRRLLRLTPIVAFEAFEDDDVALLVGDVFDAAAAAVAGRPVARLPVRTAVAPLTSPDVRTATSMPRTAKPAEVGERGSARPSGGAPAAGDLGLVALDIARGSGRVTNMMLRDSTGLTSDEARSVLQELVAAGRLERHGEKRGTHYVLPPRSPAPGPDRDVPEGSGDSAAHAHSAPEAGRSRDTRSASFRGVFRSLRGNRR